eukprot:6190419-Pleurochrysis_carterae.AAC.4
MTKLGNGGARNYDLGLRRNGSLYTVLAMIAGPHLSSHDGTTLPSTPRLSAAIYLLPRAVDRSSSLCGGVGRLAAHEELRLYAMLAMPSACAEGSLSR